MPETVSAWIMEETKTAEFGDERLDRRYAILVERLGDKPSLSLPAACKGWPETLAAYRFFDNDRVTPAKVLQPHADATLQRVRTEKVALVVQDTSEIDLTRRQERVGGPLKDTDHWGLFVHPLLVVTPERVPLGVVGATLWTRNVEEFAKTAADRRYERRHKPFEEKESVRWREGYRRACALAREAPDTQVVCVSDSEGDIYECYLEGDVQAGPKASWIVRACQDRAVTTGTAGLVAAVAATPILGTRTIEVSKREASTGDRSKKRKQARPARQATVTVRAARVELRPPERPGQKLPTVTVNAVLVREENPPAEEEPIEWLLLTDRPITTFADVCVVIDYYTCRWEIEVFFRVLKGGCRVEELQLEKTERVQACVALYLIVAWRVLFLLRLGRQCPDMSCEAVLAAEEWKSVYVVVKKEPAPAQPPTLATMVQLIASLGGYLGRQRDGPPGPKAMWIGLQRTRDFAAAWRAFGPSQRPVRDV